MILQRIKRIRIAGTGNQPSEVYEKHADLWLRNDGSRNVLVKSGQKVITLNDIHPKDSGYVDDLIAIQRAVYTSRRADYIAALEALKGSREALLELGAAL